MAEITQVIGTIRTLADAPNPLTDTQEVFDEKGYTYTQSQKNVNDDMQARIVELNTAFEQVNEVVVEVNDAREATISAKEAAELARDEAVGAVATLPDGIINDSTVSETDTWSSQKIDGLFDTKQDTLVSGENISQINGKNLLDGGEIKLFDVTVGDIVTSADTSKYTAPTWLECNGNAFSSATYSALAEKLGFSSFVAKSTPVAVVSASHIFTKFANTLLQAYNKDFIAFSHNENFCVVGVTSTTFNVYYKDNDGFYKLRATLTTSGIPTSISISNSGKYIAYTYDTYGALTFWNGTSYSAFASASVASYAHKTCSISDTDEYVIFGCESSVFWGVFNISANTTTMTLCSGISGNLHAYAKPFWLPNSNKIVFSDTSVKHYSLSGTTATSFGTSVASIANTVSSFAYSKNRDYYAVLRTVSPYLQIYKVDTTGNTLVYSDASPSSTTTKTIFWHGYRLLLPYGTTSFNVDGYLLNPSNDTVVKTTNIMPCKLEVFTSDNQTSMQAISSFVLSSSPEIINTNYGCYRYDEISSTYKFYSVGFTDIKELSYSADRKYGLLLYSQYRTFVFSVDQATGMADPLSSQFVAIPAVLNGSTKSDAYFTSCPNVFVSFNYGVNDFLYRINPVDNSISAIVNPLSPTSSTSDYSSIDMSPNGEFIIQCIQGFTVLKGAYKNSSGVYTACTDFNNGSNAINSNVFFWTADNKALFDDAATNAYRVATFTQNSPALSAGGYSINGVSNLAFVKKAKDANIYIYQPISDYSCYVFRDGNATMLVDYTSAQNSYYISDDGDVILIGSDTYLFNSASGTYIKTPYNAITEMTSQGMSLKNSQKVQFFKELGIGYSYSSKAFNASYRLPNITFTASSKNPAKAYINTGVNL